MNEERRKLLNQWNLHLRVREKILKKSIPPPRMYTHFIEDIKYANGVTVEGKARKIAGMIWINQLYMKLNVK